MSKINLVKDMPNTLLRWHAKYGRHDLPWQKEKSIYRIWVSEIMLQQTQVSTVIPYFNNFIQHFPSVIHLAKAPMDEVLHLWTGLGYYARARNLKRAAERILTDFNGIFPEDITGLTSLPGIGRSTAGAIISIALNQQGTILDGNVRRVIARLHGITQSIKDKTTQALLWEIAEKYSPIQDCAEYSQSIMDLGATICKRSRPNCSACPFKKRLHCA